MPPTTIDRLPRVSYMRMRDEGPASSKVLARLGLDDEFRQQHALYRECWNWYDGRVWEDNSGKFPIGYNPLRTACFFHRNALFGEADDTADPLVRARFLIEDDEDDEGIFEMKNPMPVRPIKPGQSAVVESPMKMPTPEKVERKGREKLLSRLVNTVWFESNGRALMLDNGLMTQILGGCVFAVRYDENQFLRIPIRVEAVDPMSFIPVYYKHDPWHLLEAYVMQYISPAAAKAIYNVSVNERLTRVEYVEHWALDRSEVRIDDRPAFRRTKDGKWAPLSEQNPFKIVPFVYIPHEREGLEFYGTPLVQQQEGLLEEINGRSADIGDAMRDGTHPEYIGRNLPNRGVGTVRISKRVLAADIGAAPPGGGEPDVFALAPPQLPQGSVEFVDNLETRFRESVFTPGVAYGEDEGSQRSALTLAFRMWPLTSHVRAERTYWTTGKNVIDEYIIRIAAAKSDDQRLSEYAVTEEDFNLRKRQDWAPMMPRDMEAQQNISVLKHQEGLVSTQTALEHDDSIDDPEEEMRRIQGESELQAQQAIQTAQANAAIAGGQQEEKPGASGAKPKAPSAKVKTE